MSEGAAPLLAVAGLCSGYGPVQVLYGIDLEIHRGEVVALLGPNGAGKTTLLRTIAGQIPPAAGTITVNGRPIGGLPPERVVGAGVVLVDEGRQVFPTLTVTENLMMGAHRRRLPARALLGECERAYDLFPRLAERGEQLAGRLSGGEQQMLVIGRALLAEPELMMIDEASMGLAPNIAELVFETIGRLAAGGLTVLVTEQYVRLALEVAGRGYVLKQGHIDVAGTAEELRRSDLVEASYLGGVS
ncbi:MAG: ABC transporter ATP-binding protein [Actinomycetota bacterium]|jgi:branched-chain amino acid transport system ATP-binding protein